MSVQTARHMIVNGREGIETYEEAALMMRGVWATAALELTRFTVTRDSSIELTGGVVPGKVVSGPDQDTDHIWLSDGKRQVYIPRVSDDPSGIAFQVDPVEKYMTGGNIITKVEKWDNELIDRGLVWTNVSREVLGGRFILHVFPTAAVLDSSTSEIAERFRQAEESSVAQIEAVLSGDLPL